MARGILTWAEHHGVDREHLVRTISLDDRLLEKSDGRIARDVHVALWRETEKVLSDPDFGLKSLELILSPASLGVVGLLAMTSANVGASIGRLVRYGRVLKEDVHPRVHVTDDLLVVELNAQDRSPRALTECSVAAYQHFMQRWTGEPILAKQVWFQHEQPNDASHYERVFQCPIHFGHPINAIAFDREVADVPLATAQPDIAVYLEESARAQLIELTHQGQRLLELPAAVADAIRETLEEGNAELPNVARRLGMSTRTLQRLLGRHGVQYRTLVDEARWAIAAPLVTLTDVPFEQIAERLGYAETKAFRRAFRRWAGVAPGAMRRAHQAALRTQ